MTESDHYPQALRVLLVDDHAIVRDSVAVALEQDGLRVCGKASGYAEALRLIEAEQPDVVVTDLSMSGHSGFELTRDVTSTWPRIGVVVLSMHDCGHHQRNAIKAGARAYVCKSDAIDYLISAIREVAGGGRWASSAPVLRQPAVATPPCESPDPLALLDSTELRVFWMTLDGADASIASRNLGIPASRVDAILGSICHKLGLRNPDAFHLYAFAARRES